MTRNEKHRRWAPPKFGSELLKNNSFLIMDEKLPHFKCSAKFQYLKSISGWGTFEKQLFYDDGRKIAKF